MDSNLLNWEYSQATCWMTWMGCWVSFTDDEVRDFHCMMDMGGEL